MPGPIDPLTNQVNPYVAEEYMAWRKRLREARAKWIEEHECPKPMTIEHTDEDGKVIGTSAVGFFEVGQQKYGGGELSQIPREAPKPTFQPRDKPLTWDEAQEELKPILDEVERFLAPGIYRESPHPEMREGEDYGEYCARIGREYEQAAGSRAVRRPVADSDGVRESAAIDPSGERGLPGPGAGAGEQIGKHLRGDAHADSASSAGGNDDGGAGKRSSDDADPAAGLPPG
jgi:hypothetical protein